jgi:hypothetical protein
MGERPISRDPQQLFADRDASAFQSPAGTGRSQNLTASVMQERRINNPLTSLTHHLPVDENSGIRKKLSST